MFSSKSGSVAGRSQSFGGISNVWKRFGWQNSTEANGNGAKSNRVEHHQNVSSDTLSGETADEDFRLPNVRDCRIENDSLVATTGPVSSFEKQSESATCNAGIDATCISNENDNKTTGENGNDLHDEDECGSLKEQSKISELRRSSKELEMINEKLEFLRERAG